MVDVPELLQLMNMRIPLIVIETMEERKAIDVLFGVANKQQTSLQRWTVTEGLRKVSFGPELQAIHASAQEPLEVLQAIKKQTTPSVFALCDFHSYLPDNATLIRLIKDIVLNHFAVPHTLVFISHELRLPPELHRFSHYYQMCLPTDARIHEIIREEAKLWSERHGGQRIKTDNQTLDKVVANLQGVSSEDVRRLVRGVIWDDGEITHTDIISLNKAKFALLDLEGIVNFESQVEPMANLGGLHHLKKWLTSRKSVFMANNENASLSVDCPKGMLLLGVQGGGKSLAAKTVASLWGVPLMRLDIGALYNKYHGETERNLRAALRLADAMSPCVLWIDEIEKAMAKDVNDGGVSSRLLGTLLTWMAERKKRVFIVATSNDISGLPPELIRKGRLDEIFFIDLPDHVTRRDIFSIHLAKRNCLVDGIDVNHLATLSDGFSGAEIEQAVIAAMFNSSSQHSGVTTEMLVTEIKGTSPLSVVMREQINALREWASNRAVMA